MNDIQTWGGAITSALGSLGERLIAFLPSFLAALIIFLAGWVVAIAVGKLVEKFLQTLRIDKMAAQLGFDGKIVEESSFTFSLSELVGGLVKWFLILSFLMASTDVLGLKQVSVFLNSVILYMPNVFVAVVILAAVFLLGNFVFTVVKGSTKAAGVMSATLLATISKWSIVIFGFFAALIQLGVAAQLVSTIFTGIVAMLALAGGLAFGLGGKDQAAEIIAKLKEELTEKR